ncbi:MAG: hypothetical protein HRF44_00805 [Ignavibacterium sp.]|jgi:hypothetical protein
MTGIASFAGTSLECIQRTVWKQEFDLRAANAVLGSFRFTDVFKRRAVAETLEGTWTLERKGFWKPRVFVRDVTGKIVAEIPWNMSGEIRIRCTMARVLRLKRGGWRRTDYEITTDMNFLLMHVKRTIGLRTSLSIALTERAGHLPELPWVLAFGIFTCLVDASGRRSR